jgi:CheY-like chemotaxis protein
MNVLLVDDNHEIRTLYAYLLKRIGCTVSESPNSAHALEILSHGNPFDLIFTDYRLPLMNGLELLHKINVLYPDAKVVMLSVAPSDGLEEQAKAAGAFACLFGSCDKNRFQEFFTGIGS